MKTIADLLKTIAILLGYMDAEHAVAVGFTHHGKYFGIPVWIAPDKDFMVATKWAPMEYVMTAAHHIEALLREVFWPEEEPIFQFLLGPEIEGGAQPDRTCEQGCNGCDDCTDYDDEYDEQCLHCRGDGMDPDCDYLLPCPDCG